MVKWGKMLKKDQGGFVSLFTVIFFTLLISVITVSFIGIIIVEQQQSVNNDLTASALNAANTGVEEAKRAILFYNSLANGNPQKAPLYNALTSNSCTALTSNSAAQSIGVSSTGKVSSQSGINEYYTCLTVNMNSPNYISNSSANKSVFVPLVTGAQPYNQIVVAWHLVSSSVGTAGDGQPTNYVNNPTTLPPVTGGGNSWSSNGYPAYLRVQLFGYPSSGSFTHNDLVNRSYSMFLVPARIGTSATTPIGFDAVDPLPHYTPDINITPLQAIKCSGNPGSLPTGTYACSATLQLPAGATYASTSNNYFLRITPLYGPTHFMISLQNNNPANPVNLQGVEPIIDVTGKAGDVFRRIQDRVVVGNANSNLPEFEVESSNSICKNMVVLDGSYFQPNVCP